MPCSRQRTICPWCSALPAPISSWIRQPPPSWLLYIPSFRERPSTSFIPPSASTAMAKRSSTGIFHPPGPVRGSLHPRPGHQGHGDGGVHATELQTVFKIIKDRFPPQKHTSRSQVIASYELVKLHDRVGRMADTQEFTNLRLPRHRFDPTPSKSFLPRPPSPSPWKRMRW